MSESTSKTSPFVIAASIAVIVFSIVGIGAMTGLIPGSTAKPETPAATTPAPAAEAPAAPSQPTGAADKPATPEKTATPQPKPVAKPAHKPVAQATTSKSVPAAETAPTEKTTQIKVCADCGVITAIRAVELAGEGSGLGAIAGGVVGGLLGHQVGGGSGKDIATIAGAIGGGYAGHQIEKKAKTTKHYEITLRMDDGSHRTIAQDIEPAFAIGDKVKILDGALTHN